MLKIDPMKVNFKLISNYFNKKACPTLPNTKITAKDNLFSS